MVAKVAFFAMWALVVAICVHGTLDKIRSGRAYYKTGPIGPWYAERDKDKVLYWASVGVGCFLSVLAIVIGVWTFYDAFLKG